MLACWCWFVTVVGGGGWLVFWCVDLLVCWCVCVCLPICQSECLGARVRVFASLFLLLIMSVKVKTPAIHVSLPTIFRFR